MRIEYLSLKKPGLYFVKSPALLTRVLYPGLIWKIPNDENKLFLTLDDGPVPGLTPWVLDVLDRFQVKATFFCVGENVKKFPDLYSEIKNRGHQTGNHSYNHLNGWKTDLKSYILNVEKGNDRIQSALFRPPYGRIKRSQIRSLKQQYKIVMWSLLAGDFDEKNSPEQCVTNIVRNAKSGDILLFHDSEKAKERIMVALPRSIEKLLDKGFRFDVIV
ncbi:MAG: polysaccharide deacetylase family protein [Bacteroidales bacterium]|nr:polysaccharide deacetylase family protein [Bacteroidales bacterium]MCF8343259.1 polysaccharide deacetylase family protein [Bacteroidales bacterium]MCF8351301.1 polysaccharide deacetylase family protein [Bacteroidales bacterium]MCF8400550.1 polysaccharide deacetylase family protein [Bacteroidales bacterium]